ncbi:hypothetical protein PflCFBP13514_09260 [Pseudomonas fluorescens]|nr:hypothetical protein PflCFBP13514_09260 [Pseudomonas fluorescens]
MGAGLARDAGDSVHQVYRGDAIAAMRRSDKPAPTCERAWRWHDVTAHWPTSLPRRDSPLTGARPDWGPYRGEHP